MCPTELAIRLYNMQAPKNDGRGVSCVRSVCTYLADGDVLSARTTAELERDKMSNYPDIIVFIHENHIGDMGCYYEYAKRDLGVG